ncbi:hypothetical protein EV401DRAFT_1844052 [Pisolithus croceorrhizus]|nr:hypothetical protein EV401DRAFT_1844052 [Pisolithus croceorrhizus]
MPTAPDAHPAIRGTQPGLLDPSQPSRLLRFADAKLHFASFDPKTAFVDRQEPDIHKLNITDTLPPPKRVVIESTQKGASFWRFVPRARLEEGAPDEGFWPRLINICGEQVYCYQEQWEIYKLDPAYRCTVFGGNKLSAITRVSLGDASTPRPEPSGVKRSRRPSPEPAPQKRVRPNHSRSSTSDDSDGTEDTEEEEIEGMLVDEKDGPGIPKLASNRKLGRVSREQMYAERKWRWRINRVVQEKYDQAPLVPTETSFSMQDDSDDSSVSPPAAYNVKRKGDSIAPHSIDGVAGSEVYCADENTGSNKRMRAMSPERTCHTSNHRHIMRERKRLQKISKFRQRCQPGHHLHFEDDLRFEFEPSGEYIAMNFIYITEGSNSKQTSECPADDRCDPEAARQAEIAESIRKMRELEKDRPLWEEQRRLREARQLAEEEERRVRIEQHRRAEEQRKLREQEAIEQERRRAAAEAERRARDELRHRENRKRRQRERWDSGPWTPIRALERYRMLSEEFDAWKFSPDESITFYDVPWPVLHAPSRLTVEDVDWSAVEAFFDAVKSQMRLQDYKAFVEKSHRRFHPDRWRARNVWLAIRDDVERGFMEVAANTVAQAITPIWRGLKAHDVHAFQS